MTNGPLTGEEYGVLTDRCSSAARQTGKKKTPPLVVAQLRMLRVM